MHAYKHCEKTKYVHRAWVNTVPDLLVFYYTLFYSVLLYSVLFHEHIKDVNKALISKAVLMASCKN